MTLDFKRWQRDGEPIAPIMFKVYVDRSDLVAAARLVASRGEPVRRGTIEAALRDYVSAYGVGFHDSIGDDELHGLSDEDDTAIESLVDRLFPEVPS